MGDLLNRRSFLRTAAVATSGALLAACQPKVVEKIVKETVIEKEIVKETVVVEGTPQVVEREVTKVVEKVVTAPPKAPEGPTFIRMSVWGYAPDMVMYTAIVQSFMQMQDEIKVTPEQYLGGYYEKIVANFAAGNSADIIYSQGIGWTPFSDNDQLLPLDSLIERDGAGDFWPDLSGYDLQCKWEDHTYMTPTDAGSIALYYNKDLFDKRGVPYPTDDWTFDDYKAIFPQLTFEEDGVKYYAHNDQNSWLWDWVHVWRRDGALEWDRIVEPTKSLWTQDDIIEKLQWFGPEIRDKGYAPEPSSLAGGGISFWEGRVAMCMDGPWYLPWCWGDIALTEGGLNYGIVECPKGTTGECEMVPSANGHTIYVNTKYADASWELMKYMMSPEGQMAIADGGRMPGIIETQSSYWVPAVAEKYNCDNGTAFVTAMQQGRPIIIAGEGLSTNSLAAAGAPLAAAVEAMKNGTPAAEALEEANPKMQKIIDDYWARKS